MVDSSKRDSHEGGKKDREKKSRGKTLPKTGPTGSEREILDVENRGSEVASSVSTITSTVPPVQENPEIERPGILTQSQIAAVQNDYRIGFSPKQIKTVTGLSLATIYKHVKGIEQEQQPVPVESSKPNVATADPPRSTLAQPSSPSAAPPKIIDTRPPFVVPNATGPTEDTRQGDSDPNDDSDGYLGYGSYGSYHDRESRRPPLPATDADTISQLLLILGRDMRKRGFANFPDFFEYYLLPQLERLEFWQANLPGDTAEQKDLAFKRYLWIVTRFFTVQKEYGEFEAANNGVKMEES